MRMKVSLKAVLISVCVSWALSVQALAQNDVYKINIPAQSLASALISLSEQTNVSVLVANDLVSGKQVESINDSLEVGEVLDILLAGTDLVYEFNDSTIVISQNTSTSEPVSTGSDSEASVSEEVIDEVVVTTQFREQSLQDVPLSISAFSGELIDDAGMSTITDVAKFTPGFTASQFSSSEPILAIRGANNTFSSAAANKPVGVFLDDVYVSRNSGAVFDLFDVEQVTVLRGPQGTLLGRNLTGGAIHIKTVKPSLDETNAKFQLGAGNFNYAEVKGLVNGPLGDSIAGKFSFSHKQRDGFSEDRLIGQETDDLNTTNLRGQMLLVPRDDLELIATLGYSTDSNNNRGLSSLEPGIDDGDIRTSEIGEKQNYERETIDFSLSADLELGAGTLKSITGYKDSDVENKFGRVGANYTLLPFAFDDVWDEAEKPKTFSQEVRFVGEDNGLFNYVAGFYYFKDDVEKDLNWLRRLNGSGISIRDYDIAQKVETESYALFGNFELHAGDYVDVAIGGRYTTEKKTGEENFVNNSDSSANFDAQRSETWNKFTPRATVSVYATDNITVFANYTEGFTSGGFNTEALNEDSFNATYDEETAKSIELGVKAKWLSGRVKTNLTFFDTKYEDKQEFIFDGTTRVGTIVNATEATISGYEAEVFFAATDTLDVNFTYSALETEYDDFIIPAAFTGGPTEDRTGNELASSPGESFSVYVDHTYSLGSKGNLLTNVSYTKTDDYFTGSKNIEEEKIDAYGLTNLNITYEHPNEQLRVGFWVNNLEDKEYKLIESDFIVESANYGAPRTYGLRLSYDM